MTIDTFSSHAILVSCDMPITCHFQSLNFVFNLRKEIVKVEVHERKGKKYKQYRNIRIIHRPCKGCRFHCARPYGFSSTFSEKSGHGGFVRQAEFSGVSEIGKLQCHLDIGVWTQFALFHEAFAEMIVMQDVKFQIIS